MNDESNIAVSSPTHGVEPDATPDRLVTIRWQGQAWAKVPCHGRGEGSEASIGDSTGRTEIGMGVLLPIE